MIFVWYCDEWMKSKAKKSEYGCTFALARHWDHVDLFASKFVGPWIGMVVSSVNTSPVACDNHQNFSQYHMEWFLHQWTTLVCSHHLSLWASKVALPFPLQWFFSICFCKFVILMKFHWNFRIFEIHFLILCSEIVRNNWRGALKSHFYTTGVTLSVSQVYLQSKNRSAH